jgi:transcriptional regulator with XRE-family HTH domain
MNSQYANDTANLVRRARLKIGQTQGGFGRILGKSQGVVSKYESGKTEPPGEIVMHCMNILAGDSSSESTARQWKAVNTAIADLVRALHVLEAQGASDRAS